MQINDKVRSRQEIRCVDPKTKKLIVTIPAGAEGVIFDTRLHPTPTGDTQFLAVKFQNFEYPIVMVDDGKQFFIKDHIDFEE